MRRDPPQLFAGEVRAIGAVLVLALLILAALVATHLGAFLMKRLSILVAVAASALLAGCGPNGIALGAPGAAAANSAMHDFLSDPNCAHHDEATFVTGAGGLPASFQAKVMRDCPARSGPAPLTTGAVVAPTQVPAAQ